MTNLLAKKGFTDLSGKIVAKLTYLGKWGWLTYQGRRVLVDLGQKRLTDLLGQIVAKLTY